MYSSILIAIECRRAWYKRYGCGCTGCQQKSKPLSRIIINSY